MAAVARTPRAPARPKPELPTYRVREFLAQKGPSTTDEIWGAMKVHGFKVRLLLPS
jgi:hypothetical protein